MRVSMRCTGHSHQSLSLISPWRSISTSCLLSLQPLLFMMKSLVWISSFSLVLLPLLVKADNRSYSFSLLSYISYSYSHGDARVCFIQECGCPGSFKQTWCDDENVMVDDIWCSDSEENCKQCDGVMCSTAGIRTLLASESLYSYGSYNSHSFSFSYSVLAATQYEKSAVR